MSESQTVLVVGATGRTGGRVVEQLLDRGANVRVIVRSAARLPEGVAARSGLQVLEADLLSLSAEELQRQVAGCDSVISCLGHTISLKGMYGSPRALVTQAATRLCDAIRATRPESPVRFILMSSVSVNHPGGLDTRRGVAEKALLALLRVVLPPSRDNQTATDFVYSSIGMSDPYVEWVAVRPDTLCEGDVTEYSLHETLVASLFKPDDSNMANVAHFMCELATDSRTWNVWKGKLPVVINARAE